MKVSASKSIVHNIYKNFNKKQKIFYKTRSALTLTEKILWNHLKDPSEVKRIKRGETFMHLYPDRVAMQDATAQMAVLQFMQSGRAQVAVPTTIHCDHLIKAHLGVEQDMPAARKENQEVYDFLLNSSQKYAMGFWGPGSGIIHQIVLENYAFPGGLLIGTDSHTPNAGGLGMMAVGVGGADAVDVMAGAPWELLYPQIVGVKLTGKLQPWVSPKDIILYLIGRLSVKGGTNKVFEYFGSGVSQISCTGKATITNMGAELGATTSVFPYDERLHVYLKATGREGIADLAEEYQRVLTADEQVLQSPEDYYDEVVEIDLNNLTPWIVGPHSPDLAHSLENFKQNIQENNWSEHLSAALIGSCTNSSYEDMAKAASIAKFALKHGIRAKVPLYISPGSEQIFATMKREGLLEIFESFGGKILANACGPCIGQWCRDDVKKGEENTIVTSFNRNFRGRNDANPETLSFIASPELVIAFAASGKLTFDPRYDMLLDSDQNTLKLPLPQGEELPLQGFVKDKQGFLQLNQDQKSVEPKIRQDSDRLQILAPFSPWDGQDFLNYRLLVKTKGKTTTDHISPAGSWLRYRGHLDRISDNLLLGATCASTGKIGKRLNEETGEEETFAAIARYYKEILRVPWVIVGDENYGEGSSREHAAMTPRYLGCHAVIARGFARIHETNLKKQGVLACTFVNSEDYDKILLGDQISILKLSDFAPHALLMMQLTHQNGYSETFLLKHSYNAEQIEWFKTGSFMNKFRKDMKTTKNLS